MRLSVIAQIDRPFIVDDSDSQTIQESHAPDDILFKLAIFGEVHHAGEFDLKCPKFDLVAIGGKTARCGIESLEVSCRNIDPQTVSVLTFKDAKRSASVDARQQIDR